MSLEPGGMLTHYRLVEKIGEGGMGVVWKAHDTKLDRSVAIKLLPQELTADEERLGRLEREARVLASLNHPGIAAIHALDHDGGNHFLVLELVDGEDLAKYIERGVIPVEDAIRIAREIATALEAAHESHVVHRDLKPANVKIAANGQVKVLDFGLAKVWEREPSDTSLSLSPTLTGRMTQVGVILGTAAYMSPEQARGQPVDKRSDIWAFGVLLYEMLVGQRLFSGDTATDILGAIVHRRPDWDRLPSTTPPAVVGLLRRCLTQELPDRLRDIGEARYALSHLEEEPGSIPSSGDEASRPRTWPWRLALAVLVPVTAVLALMVTLSREAPGRVLQATIRPPEGQRLLARAETGGPVRVSPNGLHLTFVAQDQRGVAQVWVRALDSAYGRPVPGTEEGTRPFWSPDSRSLAFFSGGKLRRVGLEGGGALAVADAPDARGGDWSSQGFIVFAPTPGSPLLRVPAGGGEAIAVTDLHHDDANESSHREPRFLPDGKRFLFLAQDNTGTDWSVYVGDIDGGPGRFVARTSGGALYAEGHLLTLRGTTLVAQRFDPERLELLGDPRPIVESVALDPSYGIGAFSAGPDGLLVYQPGRSVAYQLTWFSADGERLESIGPESNYDQLAISPDGRRAVVGIQEVDGLRDLWVVDLDIGTRTRLTFSTNEDPAVHGEPIWSPDGTQIAYTHNRTGTNAIYRRRADGLGSEELLLSADTSLWPYDWSPDGRYIVYGHQQKEHNNAEDLFAMPISGEGEPLRILNTPFNEWPAAFSPDGRWLAYDSPASGRREIYVVPFPGLDGRWQVSVDGGRYPRWSPDGRRLYFVNAGSLMAATVYIAGQTFGARQVETVIEALPNTTWMAYDVSPDGSRFLTLAPSSTEGPPSLALFLNWPESLARR